MYQIIDYYTGKQVTSKLYATELEAKKASYMWLKELQNDKTIHNNLHIIKFIP